MKKLIEKLRDEINDCGLDTDSRYDNYNSIDKALFTLIKLEEAINYTHSCTELPSKQKSCVNGIDSDTCRHNSVCDYC